MPNLTEPEIWRVLDEIPDPEIPPVSLVEMGIVRAVVIEPDQSVTVTITPTFAGCPALHVMQRAIVERLESRGAPAARVEVAIHPPWSTENITPTGREKLKAFGLAPPPRHAGSPLIALELPAVCPFCGSQKTSLRNAWGPTPCRMIYYCSDCQQPFEQFKPL